MENASSPEVQKWMKAQSDYARASLDRLPARTQILNELQRLDSTLNTFPGALNPIGTRWFYMRTPPPADVYQLFMRQGLNGPEKLVFDPQSLRSSAGSHYSLNIYYAAPDGSNVVCRVSQGGSEDSILRIVETDSGRLVDQPINRTAFGSVCWLPNGRSFVYSRLPPLEHDMPATARFGKRRVYLHELGTDTEADRPVFGFGLSQTSR
jgi:prolyl oligopeptidase